MNDNNNYKSKYLSCDNCFYTRIESVVSKDKVQRCRGCGGSWIEGRTPTKDEVKGFEMFVKIRKEGKLKELSKNIVELINQGII